MKFFLPSVLFLFAQIISSASENWPRFRGNNGDGRAAITIPPVWEKSDYRWSLDLEEEGHGSPSVWEKRVFLTLPLKKEKTGRSSVSMRKPGSLNGQGLTRPRTTKPIALTVLLPAHPQLMQIEYIRCGVIPMN